MLVLWGFSLLVLPTPTLTFAAVALFLACSAVAAGQPAQGAVSGTVIDVSGGVLPGVTVTATGADGRVLAMTVTDGAGEYMFVALPAQPTSIAFELAGFSNVATTLVVQAGTESQVVERLDLAHISETVEVYGKAPAAPPPLVLSPRRLPPVVVPVEVRNRDAICGPAKPAAQPDSLGTIASGRDGTEDRLYTTGSEVVVRGGVDNGLEAGRNLVVRRRYRVQGGSSADAVREHSAGLLQIVEAGEHVSQAVVVFACDEVKNGDFLVAYQPETAREDDTAGVPDYNEAARILFADEGQMLGSNRRLMVIGRGSEQGAFVGQRFTLFRRRRSQRSVVGEAVAVAVRADSATIRIDYVTDAISAGDWAAPAGRPSFALSQR